MKLNSNTKFIREISEEEEKLMISKQEGQTQGYNEGKKEGMKKGISKGIKEGMKQGIKYNVPISVDTIRRRYPIKWTYKEGIESLIVDTKIWVF